MIGHPLGQRHEIVVVITKSGGAGQNPHIGQRLQFGKNLLRPFVTGQTVDDSTSVETQRAADFGIFIDQNDAGAGFRGSKRRGQTSDTGTGHQHVAMGITAGIMIRIWLARRLAETGGAADQRFVNPVPGGLRPHEGLIIKPAANIGERRSLIALRSKDSDGKRFCEAMMAPSNTSCTVARTLGCLRRLSRETSISAFGSSGPAERKPRGR